MRPVFETILEAAHAASVAITVSVDEGDGPKFVYVNERAAELNGLRAEEMIGTPVHLRVAPEDLPRVAQLQAERRSGTVAPRSIEVTVLRPDGVRVPLELGLAYAHYQGRTAAVTFAHDASERRRVLDALQRSESRFRRLIESAPEAIGVARGGAMQYANPALLELLGVADAGAIAGRPLVELVHPEDRARFRRALEAEWDGRRAEAPEFRVVRPDGEVRTLEAVVIGIEFEGAPAILGFARDVTERNRVRAELIEADRLASMGTLAAGVGHEINNPLAYVLLNLQALERELPGLAAPERVAQAREMVRNALTGVDRVRSIARDLKAFSRSDPDARGPLDVRRVLESAINMAGHEIRVRGRLVTRLEDAPPVLANEARLGQVFLNLLVNAAQALPENRRGEDEIRVSLRHEDDRVIVEVSDTGPGIPEGVLDRIFEPYFTTKPPGVGTGLGLSIGRGIVTSLGGTLTAHNDPAGGATFRVSLPVLQSQTGGSTAPASAGAAARPRRTRVLIVEDEPALALALERAIADLHDALVVPGGHEALGVLSRDDRFEVVLCDLMMPGMSGIELFDEIRARAPRLADRFVFLTGGTQTGRIRDFLSAAHRPWLEKPFDAQELRQILEETART
jgi:PAS domain S-box-containing protein